MKPDSIYRENITAPVSLSFFGNGAPVGNDPSRTAERQLSQTLAYLCRKEEKTADELAQEVGIPVCYIEEELELLCRGTNGQYGLLRSMGQGKYIANIIIAHREEFMAVNEIYRRYVPAFCELLTDCITYSQEELRAFWRRNLRGDMDRNLLLWALMPDIIGGFADQVGESLGSAFPDVRFRDRSYTCVAVAGLPECNPFYSCDSIHAHDACGYSDILVRNFYGNRLPAHFHCGHDLTADPLLLLTVRCTEGMPLSVLSGEGREVARRALQQGYLQLRKGVLEPAVLVLSDGISVYMEFQGLLGNMEEEFGKLADSLAKELSGSMKKYVPAHLLDDYLYYNSCIAANGFSSDVVEECIRREILKAPANSPGPEGVLMVLCI